MRKMIADMEIKNGFIFFSGFADKNSNFVFFECGFRLSGGHMYNYFSKLGFRNNLDVFILHALTGSAKTVVHGECVDKNLRCVIVNVYAKAGTVGKISGWDCIERMGDCCLTLQHAHKGQVCTDDQAILSKLAMAYFCNDSVIALEDDVCKFYQYFKAVDANGHDMIYDYINPYYIEQWYKGDILNEL
mgnify:FL=1